MSSKIDFRTRGTHARRPNNAPTVQKKMLIFRFSAFAYKKERDVVLGDEHEARLEDELSEEREARVQASLRGC